MLEHFQSDGGQLQYEDGAPYSTEVLGLQRFKKLSGGVA
jgi:hypothetical protein